MSVVVNETLPYAENRCLSNSTLLKIGERYYQTQMLIGDTFSISEHTKDPDDFTLKDGFKPDDSIAYLKGDYYYLYKGKFSDLGTFEKPTPGIYYNDEICQYVFVDPETKEEQEEYCYLDKITTQDADEIRNAVLNHEVVIFNIPDSSHSAIPPESVSDDILKRLVKRALFEKGIDLDQYRTRFASKNMLFNTKQVLRGENRLSMLLFERCVDAFNLKYTIILEEAGGEVIGRKLTEPLVISSMDTFDATARVSKGPNIHQITQEFDDQDEDDLD